MLYNFLFMLLAFIGMTVNLNLLFLNEEFFIFLTMIIFFICLINFLKKPAIYIFFFDTKSIFINYSFVTNLNLSLVKRVNFIIDFLYEKFYFISVSEFIYLIINIYNAYFTTIIIKNLFSSINLISILFFNINNISLQFLNLKNMIIKANLSNLNLIFAVNYADFLKIIKKSYLFSYVS